MWHSLCPASSPFGVTVFVNAAAAAPGRWLRPLPGDRPALLCFAWAGGSCQAFRGWRARLAGIADVVGVELPGHGDRIAEPSPREIDAVATEVAGHVAPLLRGPYAVLGHSMGALFATALGLRLTEAGRPPSGVIVSGAPAPDVRPRRGEEGASPAGSEDDLVAWLRELGPGTMDEWLSSELRQLMLPILRADLALYESEQLRRPAKLGCPVVALTGIDDWSVPLAGVLGWQRWTAAPLTSHVVPGGHFFPASHEEDTVTLVADVLRDWWSRERFDA